MTRKFSSEAARRTLFLLWAGFFVTNAGVVFYLYFGNWIEKDNFHNALEVLGSTYEAYVGLMVAFYLGHVIKPKPRVKDTYAGMPFVVALVGSVLWNGAITAFILRLLLHLGTIEDAMRNVTFLASRLSWLVAGAIGYYFANPSGAPGEAPPARAKKKTG